LLFFFQNFYGNKLKMIFFVPHCIYIFFVDPYFLLFLWSVFLVTVLLAFAVDVEKLISFVVQNDVRFLFLFLEWPFIVSENLI